MDYKKIKIQFLSDSFLKKEADLFRKEFWNNTIPVEIEDIIDLKMKMDVIPVKDLMKQCDADALINSNWDCIYVDYEKYLDERYKNRLRFSFAHEIGHFVLHKSIYSMFGISNIPDFYKLIDEIPQKEYYSLECQANKFANYLLIPRENLIIEKEKAIQDKNNELSRIDAKVLNSYLAIPLSEIFGVSEEAIEIALNETLKSRYKDF